MERSPHSRRAYDRRREEKKKKRTHTALIVLALVLVAGFALFLILQDHIQYTSEGIRFVLSGTEAEKPQTGTTVALPDMPQSEPRREGFFPRTAGAVSVRSNGRPPYGAGYIDALFVEVEAFTVEEAEDYAASLAENGVRSIVVDIKNEYGRVNFTQQTVFSASAAALDGRLELFLSACAREGIRVTGRVCCFRDNDLPRRAREYAVIKGNAVYEDDEGYTWLDPYSEAVRENLVELCALAAKLGIREILLDDYSFLGENAANGVRFSGEEDRVELLSALLSSIVSAVGDKVVVSCAVYPDVVGEGGSEEKGQSLSVFASVCGHLWIRAGEQDEIRGTYQRLRVQSQKYADMLAVIDGESYKSAVYYLE